MSIPYIPLLQCMTCAIGGASLVRPYLVPKSCVGCHFMCVGCRNKFLLKYDANVVIVHVLWQNYFREFRPDRFDVFGAV